MWLHARKIWNQTLRLRKNVVMSCYSMSTGCCLPSLPSQYRHSNHGPLPFAYKRETCVQNQSVPKLVGDTKFHKVNHMLIDRGRDGIFSRGNSIPTRTNKRRPGHLIQTSGTRTWYGCRPVQATAQNLGIEPADSTSFQQVGIIFKLGYCLGTWRLPGSVGYLYIRYPT